MLNKKDLQDILTPMEAADMAEVSRQTIYTWMNDGELDYSQKKGGRLILKKDLEEALQIRDNIVLS